MSEGARAKEQAAQPPGVGPSAITKGEAFISYANSDKAAADSIVTALERAGISCWIAPRDVTPGVFYADAIVQALNAAQLLIVVLSAHSVCSQHVLREIERASSKKRPLVSFRLDATPLPPGLEYFLSASHWLDASAGPMAASLPLLVEAVRTMLALPAPSAAQTPSREAPPLPSIWQRLKENKVAQWTLAYAAFAFALLRGVALLIDAFEWPHEVLRISAIVMLVGLPIVANLAWYHGVKALRRVTGSELLVIGLLSVIGGGLLWLVPRPTAERIRTETASGPTVMDAKPESVVSVFAPPPHSIAVLPFTNLSGDPKQEYFSDGVSEELINALSQVNTLQVTARTSSFFFKGKDVDLETIAHKLNVGAILEGSVRRDGSTVRITAELINAATGFHMWSHKYDRELRNVLALQSEIAETVAEQLQVPLLGAAAIHFEAGGTQNPEAYDAYLRGKGIYYSTEEETGNRAAVAEFDRAIALDPNFAAAYGRRAVALIGISGEVKSVAERDALREEANTAAQRAVILAPDRADVHTALWAVRARGYFDFRSAEISRALALAPGSTLAHQCAALQASWSGHHDLALQEAREAVKLDPQSFEARMYVVGAFINARRFSEALAALQEANAIKPDSESTRPYTAYIYRLQGRDDFIEQQRLCERPPRHLCLALVKHARGDLSGANEELAARKAEWGDSGAYDYARIYAQWGDAPLAMRSLRTAERLHDPGMVELKVDPLLDPIRNQPEFKALEQRLNFPP